MHPVALLTALLITPSLLFAQSNGNSPGQDTTAPVLLQEVVVRAYEQNRKLLDVGAGIGLTGPQQLNRFSNTNILPAVNITPGVRMEERSPASYRLNIRGSSIRSPFGVRDVKIYYNEIPLTDPGGNTYLNELSFYNFQNIEIIKGPAGSLYGAGIGGAMLIRTLPSKWQPSATVDVLGGSFKLNALNTTVNFGDENHQNSFSYSHQASDGYRQQSNMRRDVASMETLIKAGENQTIHAYGFYSDLYYQTPGGLTITEYNADPKQARPPAGPNPGAVQVNAAVYQKTFLAGFSDEFRLGKGWQNTTSVYGAYTDFTNPGIRVYEIRKEPHFGGRTIFQFNHSYGGTELQLNVGAEAQKGFFTTADYKNKFGQLDSLMTNDDVNNWQYMIFAQADLKLPHGWFLTAGASFNKSSVEFTRISVLPPVTQQSSFDNNIAPRVSLLKKLTNQISIYASAAKGFSPPTVSELLKSSGILGINLQPAQGIDYEGGLKGNFFREKLYVEINAFFFHLANTIVQRIDTNNVIYSVNAGSTKQNGIESYVVYQIMGRPQQWLSQLKIFASYAYDDFHYQDFKQTSVDFSGNVMPGIPANVFLSGLDFATKLGVYANVTYTYTDRIALNDANSAWAGSYNLLDARIGWQAHFPSAHLKLNIFASGDNLFNIKYSLGNDINAANGRYYNAAPTINYSAGISIGYLF
jgi:iron complex outermembrane receptor protein